MQPQYEPRTPEHLVRKGYRLVLFQPGDTAAMHGLMRDYFAELGISLDHGTLDKDIHDPVRIYESGGLLLVKIHDSAVGCAGVHCLEPGVAELKRMYLDPEHRGDGLGRALLEAAIDLARSQGYKQLMLDTMLKLTAANRLYESAGFKDTKDYSNNPRAQRFMRLTL
jgi:GNAT superfamily N-acetyltransferase